MEPTLSRLPFLDWEENGAQTGGWEKKKKGKTDANAINKFHARKSGSYTFSHVSFHTSEQFFLFFFSPPETRSRAPISVQTL